MKKKPVQQSDGYCAFDPEGKAFADLFPTKRQCREELCLIARNLNEYGDLVWKRLRKEGYTVKRVRIVPLEGK